jgi:tRNA(fMet)-specific endonuclease VapC
MSFLIDTDICSAHLRSTSSVSNRFLQYIGRLHISVLTLGELLSWTLRKNSPPKYQQALVAMLSDVVVLEITPDIAWKFGEVRAALLDQGRPVAAADLMIAATALVHGFRVVTHNTSHFSKVPGLAIEDWLAP